MEKRNFLLAQPESRALAEYGPWLRLFRKGIDLLTVQDSSICLLELDTELIAALEYAGIQWHDD